VMGIDLVVDEGEVVTLLGANGAGQTTTLQAVSVLPLGRAGCRLGGARPKPAPAPGPAGACRPNGPVLLDQLSHVATGRSRDSHDPPPG
jgi:energy-coupling factor transporter ATP-binding protein EcfA2